MKRRNPLDQRGLTLLEMMVSIFASLIVVLSLGRVMTMNQSAWNSHQDKSDVQSNAASILDRMVRSVREAAAIEVSGGTAFTVRDEIGRAHV